jgi:drug/metabolite transporter (DMT)-like permease
MMNYEWQTFVFISIGFFVCGQILLKYDKSEDALIPLSFFTIGMGLFGLAYLIYNYYITSSIPAKVINLQLLLPLFAGFLFYFGNMYWIMSIKSSPSLSSIRVLMAGGETLLLLLVGYGLFQQGISWQQIIGSILILCGMMFM